MIDIVPDLLDCPEQLDAGRPRLAFDQPVTALAIVFIREAVDLAQRPQLRRRAAVTDEAGRMVHLCAHVLGIGRGVADRRMTTGAEWARADAEWRRAAHRSELNIRADGLLVRFVAEDVFELGKALHLRTGEVGAQRFGACRRASRHMADAAKAVRAGDAVLEEFRREVLVAADAGGVREIFRHRAVALRGVTFSAEVTASAIDGAVLRLFVRKARWPPG